MGLGGASGGPRRCGAGWSTHAEGCGRTLSLPADARREREAEPERGPARLRRGVRPQTKAPGHGPGDPVFADDHVRGSRGKRRPSAWCLVLSFPCCRRQGSLGPGSLLRAGRLLKSFGAPGKCRLPFSYTQVPFPMGLASRCNSLTNCPAAGPALPRGISGQLTQACGQEIRRQLATVRAPMAILHATCWMARRRARNVKGPS